MILSRGDVTLRPWQRGDAERTRAWSNDPEIARRVGRALPVADETHAEWFDGMLKNPRAVLYAIEVGGEHVGNVWLWDVDARDAKAEVRIIIGVALARGRGVGATAIELLAEHAHRGLALTRVYAYVIDTNAPARRAFEKAGFTLEGTLARDRWVDGAYRDVWLLGRNFAARA